MKRESTTIRLPRKLWQTSSKKSDHLHHRKFTLSISRTVLISIGTFLGIFSIFLCLFLLYHREAEGFLHVISPLSTRPLFRDQLHHALDANHIAIDSITTQQDGSLMVKLVQSNTTVYFSPDKSVATQVSSLQEVVAQLTIDGKSAYQIDFRFDVPIVRSEGL